MSVGNESLAGRGFRPAVFQEGTGLGRGKDLRLLTEAKDPTHIPTLTEVLITSVSLILGWGLIQNCLLNELVNK